MTVVRRFTVFKIMLDNKTSFEKCGKTPFMTLQHNFSLGEQGSTNLQDNCYVLCRSLSNNQPICYAALLPGNYRSHLPRGPASGLRFYVISHLEHSPWLNNLRAISCSVERYPCKLLQIMFELLFCCFWHVNINMEWRRRHRIYNTVLHSYGSVFQLTSQAFILPKYSYAFCFHSGFLLYPRVVCILWVLLY